MNLFALIIGVLLACFLIFGFKKWGYENTNKAYPVLLATFPVYYWAFALNSRDFEALFNEVVVGIVFIATALLAYKLTRVRRLVLLALGFIGHGVYDVIHRNIYNESVAPLWWPEFCGSIDLLLGVYVLWLITVKPNKDTVS